MSMSVFDLPDLACDAVLREVLNNGVDSVLDLRRTCHRGRQIASEYVTGLKAYDGYIPSEIWTSFPKAKSIKAVRTGRSSLFGFVNNLTHSVQCAPHDRMEVLDIDFDLDFSFALPEPFVTKTIQSASPASASLKVLEMKRIGVSSTMADALLTQLPLLVRIVLDDVVAVTSNDQVWRVPNLSTNLKEVAMTVRSMETVDVERMFGTSTTLERFKLVIGHNIMVVGFPSIEAAAKLKQLEIVSRHTPVFAQDVARGPSPDAVPKDDKLETFYAPAMSCTPKKNASAFMFLIGLPSIRSISLARAFFSEKMMSTAAVSSATRLEITNALYFDTYDEAVVKGALSRRMPKLVTFKGISDELSMAAIYDHPTMSEVDLEVNYAFDGRYDVDDDVEYYNRHRMCAGFPSELASCRALKSITLRDSEYDLNALMEKAAEVCGPVAYLNFEVCAYEDGISCSHGIERLCASRISNTLEELHLLSSGAFTGTSWCVTLEDIVQLLKSMPRLCVVATRVQVPGFITAQYDDDGDVDVDVILAGFRIVSQLAWQCVSGKVDCDVLHVDCVRIPSNFNRMTGFVTVKVTRML